MNKELKNILERSASAFIESALSLLTVGVPIVGIDWGYITSVSVVSFIYAMLKNVLVYLNKQLGDDDELQ